MVLSFVCSHLAVNSSKIEYPTSEHLKCHTVDVNSWPVFDALPGKTVWIPGTCFEKLSFGFESQAPGLDVRSRPTPPYQVLIIPIGPRVSQEVSYLFFLFRRVCHASLRI